MKKKILMFGLTFLILDQLLKQFIIRSINYEEVITVIPKFLYFTYVKNTGGAWSILANHSFLLLIIGLISIIIFSYYLYRKNSFSKFEVLYLGLLFGGILGNFLDRVIYSGVIDYIGFIFGSYYFPVFNLADICIVLGCFLLVIDTFRGDKNGIRNK